MNLLEAILLGILQGLTEFLPISSSGHLVLAEHLLGVTTPGLLFEVVVHLGSLFSILIVFRKDLLDLLQSLGTKQTQHFILTIIVGTIPAVLVGLLFKGWFESAFNDIMLVAGALLFTGFTLIITRFAKPRGIELTIPIGLVIGFAQSIAITPGISRAGITITIALFLGIAGSKAARFSFLLAIPAIIGAGLLMGLDLYSTGFGEILTLSMIVAFFSSLLVGIIALKWLMKTLRSSQFHWFGVYCLLIGLVTLISQN